MPAGSGADASPAAGKQIDANANSDTAATATPSLVEMMKRSRSVFEPEMRPLYADFEDAGMRGAIDRLLGRLRERSDAPEVPEWVWSLDFLHAVTVCAAHGNAPQLVASFEAAKCAFATGLSRPRPSLVQPEHTSQQVAAAVRLSFGEMLEEFARSVALSMLGADEAPGPGVDKDALNALYYDSYCVAVWTSAHAEFLATVQDLLGNRPATEKMVSDFMVPPPELYTVANLSSLLHIGALNERTASPRCCSKSSQSLLAILTRATNAGSRGWEATLLTALKESEGAVRVCMQSIAVALSGLNPVVHPAARKPWRERFLCLRALRAQTQHDFRDTVKKAPNAVKESIRLHLAAVFVPDFATLHAMQHTRQPTGQLCIPPLALPHPSLAAAMHRMAAAGADMVASRESVATTVPRHLVSEPRSRKKAERQKQRNSRGVPEGLTYSASWLGGRLAAAGVAARPAVHVVSGLFSASYRSIFIPWWLHGNHHGHRASRLDSAQYAALHNLSAAHRMCALLSAEQFQKAERLALANADASLLTVTQACQLLGIAPQDVESASPGLSCPAASRTVQEAEIEVMQLKADDAALLIAFTRIAALRATMLSYDLGEATRRKQALAVCQRLLLPLAPDEDPRVAVQTRLPKHATVLYCCSECRRVVNSVQDGSGKDQPFNELGLAASMLTVCGDGCASHMRCAKRSSAALRTAVALEASAEQLELEQLEPVQAPLLPEDLRPATIVATMCKGAAKRKATTAISAASAALRDSSSEVAKFRRDLKSCYEQSPQATSCGDVPLVCVPVLGRAIRIFGGWYALCSMCGTLARVHPSSRFRGEICCLRCDFAMLAGKEAAEEMRSALPKPPAPVCRYCHKPEPENGAGMKWRCIESPLDTGGRNAAIPPPLRTVFYCPSHYRSWLVNAHKTMSTTHIISHLVNRARPIFGANNADASTSKRTMCEVEKGKAKRPAPLSKSKTALAKTIGKNQRQRKRK